MFQLLATLTGKESHMFVPRADIQCREFKFLQNSRLAIIPNKVNFEASVRPILQLCSLFETGY